MKLFTSLFAIALIIFIGCEGPTGPQGEQGEKGDKGDDAEFTIVTGTLLAGDINEDNYWLIQIEELKENWVVVAYVRSGSQNPWFEPDWDILTDEKGITTIAIYDDDFIDPGYEYRVVILQ